MSKKSYSLVVSVACAAALFSCEDRLAGSSVGTGNPTEVQVSFMGAVGPQAISGRVDVFAATQIPVPGFRPDPLVRFTVSDAKTFKLKAKDLKSIPDSLWPKSSVEGDSLWKFNLVVSGAADGAILKGLLYRKDKEDFSLKNAGALVIPGTEDGIKASLTGLVEAGARIDPASLSKDDENFLFVYGTGYYAKADSGLFGFHMIPRGRHEMAFISLPIEQIIGQKDSTYTYGLTSPIDTDIPDSISVGTIVEKVRLPVKP